MDWWGWWEADGKLDGKLPELGLNWGTPGPEPRTQPLHHITTTYTHTHTHTHTHMHTHTHTCTHTHAHTHTHTCTHTHAHTHMHTHMHTHTCTHTCTHTHTHAHTHMHTHTHTQMHTHTTPYLSWSSGQHMLLIYGKVWSKLQATVFSNFCTHTNTHHTQFHTPRGKKRKHLHKVSHVHTHTHSNVRKRTNLHTPCKRHIVAPVKYIRICIVPSPPNILHTENIEGHVQQEVSQRHSKGHRPPGQLQSGCRSIGGVVITRICHTRTRQLSGSPSLNLFCPD